MNAAAAAASAQLDELIAWLRSGGLDRERALVRSNQGQLYRRRIGDREFVVKAPVGNKLIWRLRRSSLRREYRAYHRLEGVPGFAACHGLIDRQWLVLDFIEGQPFRDAELPDRGVFFSQLLANIQAMHDRGVAHGDLKRKSNLMVDRHGRPVIVDLGTAWLRKDGRHPFNRHVFEFMRQTDLNAWVKLKYGGYAKVGAADQVHLKRSRLERLLGRARRD